MTKNIKKKSKKGQAKSKNRRDAEQFPWLDKSLNTKRRRDYLDNLYYVEGVKSVDKYQEESGIRALNEEEKTWLNQFNKEFYGASFNSDDNTNLHKKKASDEEIRAVRDMLSSLRAEVRDEKDVDTARDLYNEIEMLNSHLADIHPRKKCTDANNERNRCLTNFGKATNSVRFIPWDDLDQSLIGEFDVELLILEEDED